MPASLATGPAILATDRLLAWTRSGRASRIIAAEAAAQLAEWKSLFGGVVCWPVGVSDVVFG